MASKLRFELSFQFGDKSVTEIIAAVDPKATRTMHREAITMAIEDCGRLEVHHTEHAERHRMARTTLEEFAEPTVLRVIDGGKS